MNISYLIDPAFQIENKNGKPAVGGHIEVYIAGTTEPYITYQDWDGTHNPHKIPLSIDGRAIILVDGNKQYDFYVYDSYNNLMFSRKNVSPLNAKSYGEVCDSIEELKTKNLSLGNIVNTTGYRSGSPIGSATYIVTENGVANDMDVIALDNGLFATMIYPDGIITPESFGAYGDDWNNDGHDDTNAIQRAIDINRLKNHETYVYLSGGTNGAYRVTSNLYMKGGNTIVGATRRTFMNLYNNASLCVWNPNNTRLEECRIRNLTVNGNFDTNYCLMCGDSDTKSITQCHFYECYFQKANTAAVFYHGTIDHFEHCYFYYSPIGLQLFKSNDLHVHACNFWDNGKHISGLCTNLNVTDTWLEAGYNDSTTDLGLNNIALDPTGYSNWFFRGCAFQGNPVPTQKLLWETSNVYELNLQFEQCRFNYAGITDSLMKVFGTIQLHIGIKDSYIYLPSATHLIDNSECTKGSLKYSFDNNTAYYANTTTTLELFTNPEYAVSMNVSSNILGRYGLPSLPNGVIIGDIDGRKESGNPSAKTEGYTIYKNGALQIFHNGLFRPLSLDNFVTPEQFGAYGDGTHDDSEAIQTAINNSRNQSRYVLLTKNNYLINNDIRISDNTSFIGSSLTTTILLGNNAKVCIGNITGECNYTFISNITIDGQNTSDYCLSNYSDSLINYCNLSNVTVKNAKTGINISGRSVIFNDCKILYNETPINISGNGNKFIGCVLLNNEKEIVNNATSTIFNECYFEQADDDSVLIKSSSGDVSFINSQIVNSSSNGCVVKNSTSTYFNIKFESCRFLYSLTTGSIFVINGDSNNYTRLSINNCTISAPNVSCLINNDNAKTNLFILTYYNNTGYDNTLLSSTDNKCLNVSINNDIRGINSMNCGLQIGKIKPLSDDYLKNNYTGYTYYDDTSKTLVISTDGELKRIPVSTTTHFNEMSEYSSQSDIITVVNKLIRTLRDENKIIS